MANVLRQTDMSPRAQAQRMQAVSGAPHLRLAGSHLDDLAVLGKTILLSVDEAKKFNAERYGYAMNPAMPRANGRSDASGEWVNNGILFMKKG